MPLLSLLPQADSLRRPDTPAAGTRHAPQPPAKAGHDACPVNFADPTGEFRILVISGIGSCLAQVLGFANNLPVLPAPRVSYSFIERQKVHKETTEKWVAALSIAVAAAVATQQESERPLRYPKYLVPATDTCHGNNPAERRVTYELYDDEGNFMSAARITENLVALEGEFPMRHFPAPQARLSYTYRRWEPSDG